MKEQASEAFPGDWTVASLAESIASLDAGVSVNAEDRPHAAGEIGVLKTSALSGGAFDPIENKAVIATESRLVSESVKADSILVSRMNTPALVGESCYVASDWPDLFLPDRIWQLKPRDKDRVSMRWLSYVLRSSHFRRYVDQHASGTSGTMKNLPKSKMLAMEVAYPGVGEQRVIAQILDTLDTAIRQTEAIIEKLKQVKQGLLHDLLTRGIDANGELRPPQSEAPHLYKASPLGWIPKEWSVGGLMQAAANDRQPILTGPFGAQLGASDFVEEGVPILRIGNVQWGFLDLTNLLRVRPEKAAQLDKYRVSEGDLLFARQGATTGRNALADSRAQGFLINYHVIRVALDKSRCEPTFVYSVFNSPIVQAQVDREKGRGTREGVNTQTLTSFIFPFPALREQTFFSERIQTFDYRVSKEEIQIAKLRETKAGLMDDLLTGRVRVTPLLKQ